MSHFIGEQVHEGAPKSRSLDLVLKPGMMISNEPGLYGRFLIELEGKKWDCFIGIRIEDDLLITERGVSIYQKISQNKSKNLNAGWQKTQIFITFKKLYGESLCGKLKVQFDILFLFLQLLLFKLVYLSTLKK